MTRRGWGTVGILDIGSIAPMVLHTPRIRIHFGIIVKGKDAIRPHRSWIPASVRNSQAAETQDAVFSKSGCMHDHAHAHAHVHDF